MTRRPISAAGAAATIAAAVVVIAGLLILGTPSRARARRLDHIRVGDLVSLSHAVDQFWVTHGSLPPTLDSLVVAHQLDHVARDPLSNVPYTYLVSGERSYRLCATFQQPTDSAEASMPGEDVVFSTGGRTIFAPDTHSWRHGAGESCFDLTPPAKDAK
jgi:hypothetical protein